MTVLLLGGTAEARRLAGLLVADGIPLVTSLAGDVEQVRTPPGDVRIGGFGGAPGMMSYLRSRAVTAVIDATHPFAARITANAATACTAAEVPLLRLSRPSWGDRPDAAGWHWVDSLAAARVVAESLGRRVFLSIGRQGVAEFGAWTDRYVLVRVVDPPADPVPAAWEVLRARGPFELADEVALLGGRRIDVLVTKDSGGVSTAAKLDAAARLAVPVVVVRRPPVPPGVPVVATVAEAHAWVAAR
ncbi:cobalt-precorrin-6A reductase [Propionicicella superfundia]|uniref:cobalt-precorrin-6A reductase n=1 Tax=Propionicicella superfundia TaxID=348582 RepID=UPI00040C3CCE|nr:cobalt-precorrin-6A reductase [Propionicicella superfundia]